MLVWQGSNYIVPLVTLPYLSRVLGVKVFGEVALSYAVAAYFVLITDWGFSLSSSRMISRHQDDRALVTEIFWDTLNAKLLIGGLSLICLLAATVLIPSLRTIFPLLAAASLAVLANVLTVNWCLQGLERLDLFAAGALIGKIATVPLILLLVKEPADAWLSIVIQTGGLVFSGVLSLVLLKRLNVIGWSRPSLRRSWDQIVSSWHVFLSTAAVNLYTTSNTVILAALSGTGVVGRYSGADRIKSAAQGVIGPIGSAVYPRVAKLMHEDEAAAFAFIRVLIFAQGALTFLISLALFIAAPLVVSIILGAEYAGAAPILRWLAWIPFVVGIGNIFGLQVLLQRGQQKLFSRIIVSAVPFSLVAIVPLILLLGGEGAAIASLATETFVTVLMVLAVSRTAPQLFAKPKRF